jgi:nucleoside phosphorylase
MGEISSAIATTLAIQNYSPLFILNQGTAGALVEWLNKMILY